MKRKRKENDINSLNIKSRFFCCGVLNHEKREIFFWCNHDLVFFGPDSNELDVVLFM